MGWFPWRKFGQPQAMVNHEERRRLLEGYLSMLFQNNQALQTHPVTLDFFLSSGAADLSIGVANVPFPLGGRAGRASSASSRFTHHRAGSVGGGGGMVGGEATARIIMQGGQSRRLMTIMVDVDVGLGLGDPQSAGRDAVQALLGEMRGTIGSGSGSGNAGGNHRSLGLDMAELRVVAIEGIAPAAVQEEIRKALVQELGQASQRTNEPMNQ